MNSLEINTPGVSTQKIRLRRVPTKREMIQNNLLQVKQNAIKKRKAQMAYYSNKVQNQSPLRRGVQTKNVQNRLGLKKSVIFTNTNKNQQVKQQQQLVLTTNKTNNNNRNNFRRQFRQIGNQSSQQSMNKFNTRNNFANRNQKFIRTTSIQERWNQIRQQPKSVKNFRNPQQQAITTNGQNKIKLRRPLNNYKIQVPANVQQQNQTKLRTLNPQLQAEIKAIQSRVPQEEDIAAPIASSKIGVTGITLNDRFSQLM
ncbi:PHD finger-containing protein DDB_G0268158-like [Onthophagus taurus]|uniref:PHD finger-containing protein DDB_G0268158-like n=1 Tax=Onthophagus taurus TaxID=166361 RepID=UPI0039BE9352